MRGVLDPTRPGAEEVGVPFATVFTQIGFWHDQLQELLEASAPSPPSRASLDTLIERLVVPTLSEKSTLIVGAGFVAAPDFLPGAPWHIAWWLGKYNSLGVQRAGPAGSETVGAITRRLRTTENPESESFRDYTLLEWWRVPEETRLPHITGPYVDYLCTDEYTLTLTVPVESGGRMVGVVGADLYVGDVERMLLPALRSLGNSLGGRATLVNRAARVVVSADPHRATGSLYRLEGLGDALHGGGTGLMIVMES